MDNFTVTESDAETLFFPFKMNAKQNRMIDKFNKPYNDMYKDHFEQFPEKSVQNHIYLNNSADAKFGNRMTVCAVCAVILLPNLDLHCSLNVLLKVVLVHRVIWFI